MPSYARTLIRSLVGLMRARAPDSDYLRLQVLTTWEKESRNLQWFGLRDGMAVRKGQVLIELDPATSSTERRRLAPAPMPSSSARP